MNESPSAIRGCFSDFKIVKTRKLAQFVIELPIEQADAALAALGGIPRSDAERWVAIALLNPKCEAALQDDAYHEGERAILDEMQKPRRAFCDLPMSTQAALKSNDEKFSAWLGAAPGDDCADFIRKMCEVTLQNHKGDYCRKHLEDSIAAI